MSLDLHELMDGWTGANGELNARSITGHDGAELIQLRVDLGVLQMFPDDRPDGTRYHGMSSVLDHVRHELRFGRGVDHEAWKELHRELGQLNYRRLALGSIGEDLLSRDELETGRRQLERALRDIEACFEIIRILEKHCANATVNATFAPTLLFNRARLLARLRLAEGRVDDAIQAAEGGARELSGSLNQLGLESEEGEDQGVIYLRQVGRRMRERYNVQQTLYEQLEQALENEDFELAARIRDQIRTRRLPPGSSAA